MFGLLVLILLLDIGAAAISLGEAVNGYNMPESLMVGIVCALSALALAYVMYLSVDGGML